MQRCRVAHQMQLSPQCKLGSQKAGPPTRSCCSKPAYLHRCYSPVQCAASSRQRPYLSQPLSQVQKIEYWRLHISALAAAAAVFISTATGCYHPSNGPVSEPAIDSTEPAFTRSSDTSLIKTCWGECCACLTNAPCSSQVLDLPSLQQGGLHHRPLWCWCIRSCLSALWALCT